MEVIDIGLSDLDAITLDPIMDSGASASTGAFAPPSANYGSGMSSGGGLEFLMNDRKKAPSGPMNIDLGELDKLENELEELTGNSRSASGNVSGGGNGGGGLLSGFTNFFGMGGGDKNEKSVKLDMSADSNIGSATADSMGNTKTWDGYSKVSHDVPMSSGIKMTERERARKKRTMLKKLEEWYEKGQMKTPVSVSADSSYEDIEDEYESALEDKRKKDSVKLQQWWFMTAVNSLEYANTAFNPFDINLDGWGEQVSEDIDSYDEIFAELYDKYKGGKLAPEISLLLRLGFSAAMVNFTNKAMSTATPMFSDIAKQNPELMRAFSAATANTMSQTSPGFAMMNNLVNGGMMGANSTSSAPNYGAGAQQAYNMSQGPAMNMGPPPPPVESKNLPQMPRPGLDASSMRPDISMARGSMFRESAADISQQYENPNMPSRPVNMAPPQQQQRPEMRGPQNTDIDNILAGLKPKPKTVDIQRQDSMAGGISNSNGDDSLLSISSLKDMQNANPPKKTNRKRGSERSVGNTISLDI